LKLLAKKVVFSIARRKNKFHHFWPHHGKSFGKIATAPAPGKNPSDAHGSDHSIWRGDAVASLTLENWPLFGQKF